MPCVIWFGANFAPGGNSVFGLAQNSVVHVIMYSYYFLASFGSKYRKYLWWKKYLTGLQLVQFATCLIQACVAYHDGCAWPEWMYWWFIGYQFSFLVLFGNFYVVNYIKKNNEYKEKPVNNGITENGFSNGINMTYKMANGKKRD